MSTETSTSAPVRAHAGAAPGLFIGVFSAALFCSALLMFMVQPMVAKTLLPGLGGTPQVWSTCMVFFQAMLFAGYLHAHFTGKFLGLKRQALLHLVLAAAALLMLPFNLGERIASPDVAHPIAWLLQVLVLSIGVPVFLISATAPLLQKWVAQTRHPAAADPYFLYAASNLGSLLALIGYPTVIEPLVGLQSQWHAWGVGLVVLFGLLAGSAWLFWRDCVPATGVVAVRRPSEHVAGVTHGQRLRWVLLSLAPTSLLLGVTSYITTDVAAVPLFWVVPLALYLLTFILVFAQRPPIAHGVALRAQAFVVTLVAVGALVSFVSAAFPWPWIGVHLLGFFLTALVCHGELARSRPDPSHLTEYYLWLSFGGVLGGVLTALLAPLVFSGLAEYPLALVLACILRPPVAPGGVKNGWRRDILLPCLLLLAVGLLLRSTVMLADAPVFWRVALLGVAAPLLAIALLSFSTRPLRFALGVAALSIASLLSSHASSGAMGQLITSARSFFGVYKVYRHTDLGLSIFVHGSTIHGTQFIDPSKANQPGAYYHHDGSFGQMFRALAPGLGQRAVAIVGLGSGSLACYGAKGSQWTFYEIDPLVEQIARDPRHFTFLRDCPPTTRVVIGDARVTLRNATDASYSLLLIDAFTSDAIPTHLLTREAMSAYRKKLTPDGVLAVHISNRFLDLLPVLSRLAQDAQLVGRVSRVDTTGTQSTLLESPAQVVVLAADEASFGSLANDPRWLQLPPARAGKVWSDDYVNIIDALRFSSR